MSDVRYTSAADRAYRLLLRLYPRAFRERFGAEMLALFAQTSAAAPRTLRGRLDLWRSTLADLVPSAARERLPARRSLSMSQTATDFRQAWRAIARAPFLAALVVLLMALIQTRATPNVPCCRAAIRLS